jgi:hypothetical protein
MILFLTGIFILFAFPILFPVAIALFTLSGIFMSAAIAIVNMPELGATVNDIILGLSAAVAVFGGLAFLIPLWFALSAVAVSALWIATGVGIIMDLLINLVALLLNQVSFRNHGYDEIFHAPLRFIALGENHHYAERLKACYASG